MPAIDLETPRLFLRPMSLEDSPAVQRYFDNWNIIKYIGGDVPWPYPADGAMSYLSDMLEKVSSSETYLWGLVIKGRVEEIVGVIEYRLERDEDDNRGFWLGEPFWGQGFMTEAVVATQDYVFFRLQIDRLVVRNAESNEGSRIIKQRCGAEKIDVVKGDYSSGDLLEEVWEIKREKWISMGSQEPFNKYRIVSI